MDRRELLKGGLMGAIAGSVGVPAAKAAKAGVKEAPKAPAAVEDFDVVEALKAAYAEHRKITEGFDAVLAPRWPDLVREAHEKVALRVQESVAIESLEKCKRWMSKPAELLGAYRVLTPMYVVDVDDLLLPVEGPTGPSRLLKHAHGYRRGGELVEFREPWLAGASATVVDVARVLLDEHVRGINGPYESILYPQLTSPFPYHFLARPRLWIERRAFELKLFAWMDVVRERGGGGLWQDDRSGYVGNYGDACRLPSAIYGTDGNTGSPARQ
jgi:hypothetical protein